MKDMPTVRAIFSSYAYNRNWSYMVELCREVLERTRGIFTSSNCTYDGDIIYGFLVLMYGDYGTSPRTGWIENYLDEITECINELIEIYKRAAEEEEEDESN